MTDFSGVREYKGSCHCGNIKYRISVDLSRIEKCNCTFCDKAGWINARAKGDAFYLIEPPVGSPGPFTVRSPTPQGVTEYVYGDRTMRRFSCPRCGITPFIVGHLPIAGGNLASTNVRCLNLEEYGIDIRDVSKNAKYIDGRHDNYVAGLAAEPYANGCW